MKTELDNLKLVVNRLHTEQNQLQSEVRTRASSVTLLDGKRNENLAFQVYKQPNTETAKPKPNGQPVSQPIPTQQQQSTKQTQNEAYKSLIEAQKGDPRNIVRPNNEFV